MFVSHLLANGTHPTLLCCSRVILTPMMVPVWTTATLGCPVPALHPVPSSTTKQKHSEVQPIRLLCFTYLLYKVATWWVYVCLLWSTAGLSSALAGQVPSNLELKVEKPDKDDMSDNLSTDNMADDDSDKNMRTPRAGTRTRYKHGVYF